MENRTRKTTLIWIVAVIITLTSVFIQRTTGPTYPVRINKKLAGAVVKGKLLTSHESTSDAEVRLLATGAVDSAVVRWKRLNSHDEWSYDVMLRSADTLRALLPKQPPAGKLVYSVNLYLPNGIEASVTDQPVVMRFKGAVPPMILIPHILMMFISMLLASRTGLEAALMRPNVRKFAIWTAIPLFIGGLILGPIVQKYAFGAYWTGWPFGHDLTDNKTALAMLMWLVAIWRGKRWWYIAAAVVHFLVYLIPHSMFGSELDYRE